MNVYKLTLTSVDCKSWGKGVAIVGADSPGEARAMFQGVEEVELLPGVAFDPNQRGKPVAFNVDKTPMLNVISYDWFED